MAHKEDATLNGAQPATRQPPSVEPLLVPPEAFAENAPSTIQYVDDEAFRRSLEKAASLHERLLAKLAE